MGFASHNMLGTIRNAAIVVVGIGILTFFLFDAAAAPFGLVVSIGVSGVYVGIMWGAQHLAGTMAERTVPLRSRRDVALRLLMHAIAMVGSFVAATMVLRSLVDFPFLWNRWTLTMIALVAVCVSLVGHGAYYLRLFYERARAAERATMTAQLRALRAQINPHFLFNSLNSIAALIRSRPGDAERMIESLADLFRYSLRSSEQPTVRLSDEIASVELYLDIERVRFGDRLGVDLDVEDGVRNARVPSLLLQPLVENAVKHGADPATGRCRVRLRAGLAGGNVRVRVADEGPGFHGTDLETLCSRGAGLANVRDRLAHHFGAAASIVIERNAVVLTFPHADA